MITVKVTPQGVVLTAASEAGPVFTIYKDPKKLQDLIETLDNARQQLVENRARSAEEGISPLWENV